MHRDNWIRQAEEAFWDTLNQQMWEELRVQKDYRSLLEKEAQLLGKHERVALLLEGRTDGPVTLSETETAVLEQALQTAGKKEELERRQLYDLGYLQGCRLGLHLCGFCSR